MRAELGMGGKQVSDRGWGVLCRWDGMEGLIQQAPCTGAVGSDMLTGAGLSYISS